MSKKKKEIDTEYGTRADVRMIVGNLPDHPSQMQRWYDQGFPEPISMGYRTRLWHLPSVRAYMEKKRADAAAKAAARKMLKEQGGRI